MRLNGTKSLLIDQKKVMQAALDYQKKAKFRNNYHKRDAVIVKNDMRTGTQSDYETPQLETSYDWKNNYTLNNT